MNEEQAKAYCGKVDEHEKRLHDGDISIALIKRDMETIHADIAEIKVILKALSERPVKSREKFVSTVISIISSVISGACMLVIAKIFTDILSVLNAVK